MAAFCLLHETSSTDCPCGFAVAGAKAADFVYERAVALANKKDLSRVDVARAFGLFVDQAGVFHRKTEAPTDSQLVAGADSDFVLYTKRRHEDAP